MYGPLVACFVVFRCSTKLSCAISIKYLVSVYSIRGISVRPAAPRSSFFFSSFFTFNATLLLFFFVYFFFVGQTRTADGTTRFCFCGKLYACKEGRKEGRAGTTVVAPEFIPSVANYFRGDFFFFFLMFVPLLFSSGEGSVGGDARFRRDVICAWVLVAKA